MSHSLVLRAMWPFPVLNQFPLLWPSLTPRASSSCQDWHRGRHGLSPCRCSSGRGTRRGFSWPLTSCSRRAQSGCTWARPDSAYRLAKSAGPSWSSAQVSPVMTTWCWELPLVLDFIQGIRATKKSSLLRFLKLDMSLKVFPSVKLSSSHKNSLCCNNNQLWYRFWTMLCLDLELKGIYSWKFGKVYESDVLGWF